MPRPPLEPLGQLSPQAWMQTDSTRAVIAALTAEGAEVRFVGGCVRDSVLHRPIKDIDIATHQPPQQVMEMLERAGIRAIPTGIDHGTVTAVIGRDHFEITTLREDVETNGRHAQVSFTDDWVTDASRRDFTMNAMFADPQGRIYDPFNGLRDLGDGTVRFVGDPLTRIDEDVLRLLRFFRFYAHYGRPPMDKTALAACRKRAGDLMRLSGERLSGELIRLLEAPDPAETLAVMRSNGILETILPEAQHIGRLKMLSWLESRALVRDDLHPDPIRRLACLLVGEKAEILAIGERLKLSRSECQRLLTIVLPPVTIQAETSPMTLRQAIYHHGTATIRDLILTAWAQERDMVGRFGSSHSEKWIRQLDLCTAWTPPSLPIRGADCLEAGLPKGPAIGTALSAVEDWWLDQDFQPDRRACLEHLRKNFCL